MSEDYSKLILMLLAEPTMKAVSSHIVLQITSVQYLPFLYCTRTILSASSRVSRVKGPATFSTTSALTGIRDGVFNSEAKVHSLDVQEKRVNYIKEKSERAAQRQAQHQAVSAAPKSTITPKETQIFRKIFNDIAGGSSLEGSKPNVSAAREPEFKSPIDYHEIFSIFSNATLEDALQTDKKEDHLAGSKVESRQSPNEGQRASPTLSEQDREHIQKYPQLLRSIASRATLLAKKESRTETSSPSRNSRETPQHQMQLDDSDESHPSHFLAAETEFSEASIAQKRAIDLICAAQMKRISAFLMKGAELNDQALWEACEGHVLPLLAFLEAEPSHSLGSRRIGPSFSADTATSLSSKENLRYPTEALRIPASPLSNVDSREGAVKAQAPFHIPPEIPSLPIISTLYPALLLLTLRLLTTHFPLSPYATTLLPTIRSLGLRSYVLGTSIQLYNTLLSHRWVVYSDLRGMNALLTEMERGGVDLDTETVEVLERVRADKLADEIAEREAKEEIEKEDREWRTLTAEKKKKKVNKRAGLMLNGMRPAVGGAGQRGKLWWDGVVADGWFERIAGGGGWRGKVMESLRERAGGEDAVVEREYAGAEAVGEEGEEGEEGLQSQPKVWL